MKHFLCYDHTEDSENLIPDGQEFLTEATPADLKEKYDKAFSEDFDNAIKIKLNLPLLLGAYISGALGIGLLASFLAEKTSECGGFISAIKEFPLFFGLGCIFLIAGIIMAIIFRMKNKKDNEADVEEKFATSNTVASEIFRALNVPEDAKDTQIISFNYLYSDGECAPTADNGDHPHFSECYKVYAENGNICLAQQENGKYTIPLSSIRGIRKMYTEITVDCYLDDLEDKNEAIQRLEMEETEAGDIKMPYHYALEFESEGDTWQLLFPAFELDYFEKLTGITA